MSVWLCRNFDLIGSVDDHSAAVTSIKVSSSSCNILSCSADRYASIGLVFQTLHEFETKENNMNVLCKFC
jgi:WD40 repeat protein